MRIVSFEPRHDRATRESHARGLHALGVAGLELEGVDGANRRGRRLGGLLHEGSDAGSVVDLGRALEVKFALADSGAPEAEADALIPSELRPFLAHGDAALEAARSALDFAARCLEDYDAPDLRSAGIVLPRRALHLHAPIARPGKLIGVARNYADHALERGGERPEEPVLFLKASSAVVGPEDEIRIPAAVREPDYEGELAVVIGRDTENVPAERALEHVAGYCVANDVSARDFQHRRGQHFLGKSCDSFAPLGPALVCADEIPDPQDLGLVTLLSGEVVQSARTKDMLFPVAEIVAFASRLMRLEPGDVILSGTPAGVGASREPPRWLRDGDVVEVEIERVGRLANYVRREG